jgi:hypothetical protein
MKNLSRKALIKEFNEFLRENNCASKFYVNRTIDAPEKKTSLFFKHHEPAEWIGKAFIWFYTPQKKTYWISLNIEWEKRLKAIEYNLEKSKSK